MSVNQVWDCQSQRGGQCSKQRQGAGKREEDEEPFTWCRAIFQRTATVSFSFE